MATTIVPKLHDWVKWSIQSVGVIVDPFTGASSAVEFADSAIGEQIGCHFCGEPLTDSSATSQCRGDTEQ
jgi:hypothetical protein